MQISFTKMHGAGNDYLFVRVPGEAPFPAAAVARMLSPRHTGVGADGLVLLSPGKTDDTVCMRMYNADGSEGAVCGNALRCAAHLWALFCGSQREEWQIACRAGVRRVRLHRVDGKIRGATVDMGALRLLEAGCPVVVGGESQRATLVFCGNRHAVFLAPPPAWQLEAVGQRLCYWQYAPAMAVPGGSGVGEDGFNTEFVYLLSPRHLAMRVFERGSGETLACGSGACAAVYAAVLQGWCQRGEEIAVQCPGGCLYVTVAGDNTALLRGETVRVFEGVVTIDNIEGDSQGAP